MELPKKYNAADTESRWSTYWDENDVYAWDAAAPREDAFVVDTPPPTVSGSLHVGHLFSYSHQDFIARFQRMRGKNVFFPIGWDDNGLPTERRVQNLYNVRCEPHIHYDADLTFERGGKGDPKPISRRNFIELCEVVTQEDEEVFRRLWKHLGLSYDWSQEYATIAEHARRISQLSFIELLKKGEIYQDDRPVLWDVDFRTAIAQAEVTDKDVASAYHFLRFGIEGTEDHIVIATTRPELLPACVAVLAHPTDERYQHLFGKNAVTPLFEAPVPIMADPQADPEKGTGIVMVCTYGDQTDVEWQRRFSLPVRQILDRDGHLTPVTFVSREEADGEHQFISRDPDQANSTYHLIQGKYVKQAQKLLVEHMEQTDGVIDRPKENMSHAVRFFEKGERPLELIPARQWFSRILDHKEALVAQGRKIAWHPEHMGIRYEHWVEGLNQDWCLSRQRFFGVPIPVWYKVDEDGNPLYDTRILPEDSSLPIDPLDSVPPGYAEEQRDQPNGFTGDPDVLDTWATSSLTPQIVTHWLLNKDRHAKLFPMDIRPQSHEIIRTWAFYTIVKAYLHDNEIPWRNVVISGWILDPDRKKMSKSQGNVVTPEPLVEQHGADSVRYWAARARLGVDTAFDEQVFQVGKRLCTKLFNASKFAIGRFQDVDPVQLTADRITVEMDRAVVQELRPVIERATQAFEKFDYAQALQLVEGFFWGTFCDNYLEIAKPRTYDEELTEGRLSALATLRLLHRALVRLLAPFLPYLAEEVWHWAYNGDTGMHDSVHRSPWPSLDEIAAIPAPERRETYEVAIAIIEAARRAKADANLSMKAPIKQIAVTAKDGVRDIVAIVQDDITRMLNIEAFSILDGDPGDGHVKVEVEV